MDRHVARALLIAWNQPEFRAALQHLIDLDEVTTLLAALADGDPDEDVAIRGMGLLHSALTRDDVRTAIVLLLDNAPFRQQLAGAVADGAGRPELGAAIASALDDATVRQQLRVALDNVGLRELMWRAAQGAATGHRGAAVRALLVLLLRHRSARRLVGMLRRHGVLRALRRPARTPETSD